MRWPTGARTPTDGRLRQARCRWIELGARASQWRSRCVTALRPPAPPAQRFGFAASYGLTDFGRTYTFEAEPLDAALGPRGT